MTTHRLSWAALAAGLCFALATTMGCSAMNARDFEGFETESQAFIKEAECDQESVHVEQRSDDHIEISCQIGESAFTAFISSEKSILDEVAANACKGETGITPTSPVPPLPGHDSPYLRGQNYVVIGCPIRDADSPKPRLVREADVPELPDRL